MTRADLRTPACLDAHARLRHLTLSPHTEISR
ncbi:MAG: hypothetical protein JWQ52_1066 [Phenylobacterium sp.]|jgi:hypothetical protein|nr:hypothetical protein [Phenylobacterium sp.]